MALTRRDLLRLSAASAVRWGGSAQAEQEQRTVGYCVVGLGRIAGHFLEGSRPSKYTRITGLVSGHRDKAEKIAAQYNVPASSIYSYENYDAIAGNKAIDAVIVCLPNSMHAEYTIRAARGGQARAVREAHVHQRGGWPGHDRGLPQGRQEADDRLPLPLRAGEPAGPCS